MPSKRRHDKSGETRSRSAGRPGPQQMVQNLRNTTPHQPAAGRDVPRSKTQQADAAPHLQLITPERRRKARRTPLRTRHPGA